MMEQAIKNIIPEDWGYDRLRNLCRVFSGYAFKSEDFVSSGIVVVKIGNLQNGTLVIDNRTTYFPENKVSCRHQRFVLHKDDVLIALTGATTGKIAVVPPSFDGALLNQRVGKFEINRDKLNQLFFRFYALTGSFQKEIKDNILQSAQGNVSPQKIESFEILIPRVWEQRKIAYVLYELHRAIAQQEQIIAKTKELKRSLMHRLFTYGLRGEGLKETEIGLMPESWELSKLGDIATLKRGYDLPRDKFEKGKIPVMGSNGCIGYHSKPMMKGPGVITGRSGSIGKITYIEDDYWPHNTALYVKDFHGNYPLFIYYLLHKLNFNIYKTGVSVPTLNRNFIHMALLPKPSIEEQKEITNILSNVDKRIQQSEARKQTLQALFKSMLQLLMTGQVRVKDIDFGKEYE